MLGRYVICTEFSKAFDRESHVKLLRKLHRIIFDVSERIAVKSEVPQDVHCSPLLFNSFLNNIGKY